MHLAIGAVDKQPKRVIGEFKRKASDALFNAGIHPMMNRRESSGELPTCWARNGWTVYLDREEDVQRAVQYVEQNPVKEGKPPQRWPFVTIC